MQRTKGFTLIELLVVIAIIALLIGLLLPALAKAQMLARSLVDSTQVAQIHAAMLVSANENDDRLPTPGLMNRLPVGGVNVPGIGPEDHTLNHTGPMYSMLVAQRFLPPKILVGTTEVSPLVVVDEDYDFDTYDPGANSYWDPAFVADLRDQSNTSYAHMAICGERKKRRWNTTQAGGDPILGNRAPEFGTDASMTVLQTPQFKQSPTLDLHGPSKRWVGYVCFNDNHVEKLDTFYAPLTSYEPMNAFEVRNDHLYAKEFADALSASDPNEGSGDAWLVICVGASADGDQVDEVYDP